MQRRMIMLDVADRVRALERVPLLQGCPPEELAFIAERSHILTFRPADVIVPEGEEGLGFYVVLGGRARVLHRGEEIDQLYAGDFFGEISLLEGRTRSATVVAAEHTTCLGILRSFFRPMLVRNPRLALRILDEELRRLQREPGAEGSLWESVAAEAPDELARVLDRMEPLPE